METDTEIEHSSKVLERVENLFLDSSTADMMFVVEGERLPAHRLIVSTSCEYFRALLGGSMMESLQSEVVLKGVSLRGFKLLLSYVYTGRLSLGKLDGETMMEILEIAHMYGYENLVTALCQYFQRSLSIGNVHAIYGMAHLRRLEALCESCRKLMIEDPEAILESEDFYDLPEAAFTDVISLDTFCADEIKIFKAVDRWRIKHPMHADLSRMISAIRLPLIETKHIVTTVKDSGLIPNDLLFDAIRARKWHSSHVKLRGVVKSGVNLISLGCRRLKLKEKTQGSDETARSRSDYDSEDFPPPRSEFELEKETGLTIVLDRPVIVNNIAFRIPYRDSVNNASYFVETSVNLLHWVRVIDHTKDANFSSQNLFFEPRVVRYIRVMVTRDSYDSKFVTLSAFQVNYIAKP